MRRALTRIAAVGGTSLVAVALVVPPTAVAEIDGDFAGQSDSGLLYLDAVNLSALQDGLPSIATLGVAPTQAQVSVPDGLGGGALTRGFGANLDPSLLGQEVPLDLTTAEQTAPPDNPEPVVTTLVPLDAAAPLLTGSVSESTANARDPQALECPDVDGRTPVATGTSTTTDLGLLQVVGDGNLIGVVGEGEGTLTASSGVFVGSEGQVIAESTSQTAEVNIADQLRIEVVDPVLTATASGTPGGASVTYSGEVLVNGDRVAATEENALQLDVLEPLLAPLDELLLDEVFGPIDEQLLDALEGPLNDLLGPIFGETLELPELVDLLDAQDIDLGELLGLQPIVTVTAGQLQDVVESPAGTTASGSVTAATIELNLVSTLADTEVPILAFDLAPMTATAEAPEGGLDCGDDAEDPFNEVAKDVSAARVRPGTTFDYAITVPNRAECTVTDVTVTDLVEGPDGFEIVATDPTGEVDGDTVTWTLDELAPNEVATFVLTVRVPDTAVSGETFTDNVTATGTCDGQPVSGDDELPDVPSVTTDSLDGCDVSASNKASTHLEVMPGQAFSYLVHAYNAGDEDCGPTTVTDTLPDGVTFVSCTPACTNDGSTVVFELDELAAGESRDLTVTVTAPDEVGADIPNTAIIDPEGGDAVTVTTPGPEVTDQSVLAPPDPADFDAPTPLPAPAPTPTPTPQPTPDESLPRTGGGLALLGLGVLAAADRLRRRR